MVAFTWYCAVVGMEGGNVCSMRDASWNQCCKSMLLHMEGADTQLHSLGCMTVLWQQRS